MISKKAIVIVNDLCNDGIDEIVNMIRTLEIKPMIDEVIRDFEFDKVSRMISTTTNTHVSSEELQCIALQLLKEVAEGYMEGKTMTAEYENGLVATYNAPGDSEISDFGEFNLKYIASESYALQENHQKL